MVRNGDRTIRIEEEIEYIDGRVATVVSDDSTAGGIHSLAARVWHHAVEPGGIECEVVGRGEVYFGAAKHVQSSEIVKRQWTRCICHECSIDPRNRMHELRSNIGWPVGIGLV